MSQLSGASIPYQELLNTLPYKFNGDTCNIIQHERDFDNEDKPIGLINLSENVLWVLELDLSDDEFKYKEYNSKNIRIYPLKQHEHVYIKAERYYSVLSKNDVNYIRIELTEDPKENSVVRSISKTVSNNEVFESFLYDTMKSDIKKLFDGIEESCNLKFKSTEHPDMSLLKMKYDEALITSIEELHQGKINTSNLFFNSKLIRCLYSRDVCYWILNECFKNTFSSSVYEGFGNMLPISNMPHILDFVLYSSNLWITYFKKTYDILKYDVKLNISEIFIANNKEKYTVIKDPIRNKDKFICKILLNDTKDFTGGRTILNDCITPLEQGEMLIYHTTHQIGYEDITFGESFYIVFFLDIGFNL